jgi:hypothetical protein
MENGQGRKRHVVADLFRYPWRVAG